MNVETGWQDIVACGEDLHETKRVRDPQGAYEDNVHQGDLHHFMSRPLQFFFVVYQGIFVSLCTNGLRCTSHLRILASDSNLLFLLTPDTWHVAGLTVSRRACWDPKRVSDKIYALA